MARHRVLKKDEKAAAEAIPDFAAAVPYLEKKCVVKDAREGDGTILVERYCRRCGGDGRYSFNLRDGDKCFECACVGRPPKWFVRVDAVEEAQAVKAKELADERAWAKAEELRKKAEAEREATAARFAQLKPVLVEELASLANADGRFDDFKAFAATVRERGGEAPFEMLRSLVRDVADEIRARRLRALNAKRGHVGQPGKRLEAEVVYVRRAAFPVPGVFGRGETRYVYNFETADEARNRIVWFTGAHLGANDADGQWQRLTEGSRLTVKATVKAHVENKRDGGPETTVQRLAIVEVLELAPDPDEAE